MEIRNFFIGLAAILLFGYLGGFIAWWGIALVAMIVGFALQMKGGWSFLCGLLGGGGFYAIYCGIINSANNNILSDKMNIIMKFDTFWVTILIGALLGAMGMLTGKYMRDVATGEVQQGRSRSRYR